MSDNSGIQKNRKEKLQPGKQKSPEYFFLRNLMLGTG